MPEIDVTEVLLGAEIAGEQFIVIRRPDVVGDNGVTVPGFQQFSAIGQITPTGSNSLVRAEAFQSQDKSIRVATTFMLRGPAKDVALKNYQPDIVIWKGDSFIVRSINDNSAYGAGFIIAECSSYDFIDLAPSAPPAIRLGPPA